MPPRLSKFAKPPAQFTCLDEFLNTDRDVRGSVEVVHHGIPLHFYLDWRDASTTIVTFSGAISAKVQHAPAWAGFGITSGLEVNRLLISDPSIVLSQRLGLAWYGGNLRQPHLQDDLTQLISQVCAGTRIIFFGPSGGGFASLLQASRLPGSTAVVSNPQTDMRLFNRIAVERYLAIGWDITEFHPTMDLPFVSSVLDLYSAPVDANVVYLQNIGDIDHMDNHYNPFLEALDPTNRVVALTPYLGDGHKGPDKESFKQLFETVIEHPEWDHMVSAVRAIEITRNI